jgi:hypothetical protein
MEKPRPPEDRAPSKPDKVKDLVKLPHLMIRQYLRKEPNNYPHYLYKYLSSNMKVDHIRCILIDSDFYLSSCTDFNDPFDTTANVVNKGSLKELRTRFGEIVDRNMPNLKKSIRDSEVSRLMVRFKNPDNAADVLTKNTQSAGICSLTENSRDILMWSHYANHHKGMLLQFEIAKDPESLLFALKMDYSNEYPEYDISKGFELSFQQIMLGKSLHWKYENEWRILRIAGARTFQPFKHEALTTLIFGCRAETEFINTVIGILKQREDLGYAPVRVLKAEMHKTKYALKYFKLAF